MSSSFDPQRQESLKRMWRATAGMDESLKHYKIAPTNPRSSTRAAVFLDNEELVAGVVPAVTVVLEGRSICQRISLHKHTSYHSLALALRHMFVHIIADHSSDYQATDLNLSNAVPGHLVAYEDMENDLLLVGDLDWKDFVRVAKRIRILPVKAKSRKQTN